MIDCYYRLYIEGVSFSVPCVNLLIIRKVPFLLIRSFQPLTILLVMVYWAIGSTGKYPVIHRV